MLATPAWRTPSPRHGRRRRHDRPGLRSAALALAAISAWSSCAAQLQSPALANSNAPAVKVLRVAFSGSENGFDPAQISDTVSVALVEGLFDAPLTYEYLARPARLKPRTAVALPEVHDDHTRFVFRIRPGIHFSDDPAFGGRKRELTAADYVYSVKRYYDPAVRSPTLFHYEGAGLLGLSELRREAIASKRPFPYDTEVPGIRTLDRYTFEVRTARPAPRLPYVFATPAISGALAREVVEAAGERVAERPVGTGPFRLAQWKRRSSIVFERNPNHESVFDEEVPASSSSASALGPASSSVSTSTPTSAPLLSQLSHLRRLHGQRLPFLDRVEFSIIEEAQPRWLAFLNREVDVVSVPAEFAQVAAPGGRLAPNLAKAGIEMQRVVRPLTWFTYFGMEHPVVGGYTPERVALRRALALAYHVPREVQLVRKGHTVPAQSVLPPEVSGFDPALKTEMSDHDPARARSLLDLYGYVDKNGDGWRDQPDGQPLVLELTTQPDQLSRALQELWHKSMREVGVRIVFRTATWQENIKASRAGKLMMWTTGWAAALPDGGYFLDALYGKNKGLSNPARFDLPEFNDLYERQRLLPDGPERDALIAQALKLSVAYMPLKATGYAMETWLTHPQVRGYVPHPFMRDYWRFIDLDAPPAATGSQVAPRSRKELAP
jgi:ABC-type transport system substrate-binding protein